MGQTIDINTERLKTGIAKLENQKQITNQYKRINFQTKGSGLAIEKIKQFENLYTMLAIAISDLYSNTIDYMNSLAQSATQTDEAIANSFGNGE